MIGIIMFLLGTGLLVLACLIIGYYLFLIFFFRANQHKMTKCDAKKFTKDTSQILLLRRIKITPVSFFTVADCAFLISIERENVVIWPFFLKSCGFVFNRNELTCSYDLFNNKVLTKSIDGTEQIEITISNS